MWISTEVRISFDPVKEQNMIQQFFKQNDLSEWHEDLSSFSVTFVKKQVVRVGGRGEEDD